MGSVIVYAIITVWIVAMIPAVLAPFLMDRPKRNATVAPQVTAIPFRRQIAAANREDAPSDRPAA